ncbi:low temperature requirement protein A [Micromonospora sp. NPDC049559]|uniref:low temperature requirement protein A n=1 Tax=Micromonospora sp. NPDC049559 TaxID=3155923 RepID=UPI003414B0F7
MQLLLRQSCCVPHRAELGGRRVRGMVRLRQDRDEAAREGKSMMAKRAPLRSPDTPERATFLELFFDLAFVFALLQVSRGLVQHLDWSGAFHTLILLLALWRVWLVTTWITNRLDPQWLPMQLMVVTTLLASLVLATALPQAFGKYGLIFAGVYVAIQPGRYLVLLFFMRGHELQGAVVRALWSGLVSSGPWIAGAFTHGSARTALWTFAIAVEYAVFAVNIPLPWAGHVGPWQSPTSAEHLAERYRQFFIVALGVLTMAGGLALDSHGFTPARVAAFVMSVAVTALIWRTYIYRAGEVLSAAFRVARTPARLGIGPVYAHLVMVAGIVGMAGGIDLVIAQPLGPTPPAHAIAFLGGPALFLAGRAGFEYIVFAKVSWNRPTGALVLVALILPAIHRPPIVATVAVLVVMLGVAITDAVRIRHHRGELEPPRVDGPS